MIGGKDLEGGKKLLTNVNGDPRNYPNTKKRIDTCGSWAIMVGTAVAAIGVVIKIGIDLFSQAIPAPKREFVKNDRHNHGGKK